MLSSPQAEAEFRQFLFDLLEPPSEESVVEWCENNVIVPTGAMPGRLSLRMTPYLREPLERFGDKRTRYITLCYGSQSAKSTLLILGMLYRVAKDAQDSLWVLANGELAKDFSKSRWMKYIQDCPPVLRLVPVNGTGHIDRTRYGFTHQLFSSMTLNFVGSNSPANLSSRPVGILVMDEVDKYGEESKYEAAAIELAEERTKTYPFPLVVKASTPTLETRMIWPEYLNSDQRRYWVPCPRCGREILLKFQIKTDEFGECGVRWWRESPDEVKIDGAWDLDLVSKNTFYKCQACGGEIEEHERPIMVDNGVWRPDNPRAEPGRHGYQLSSLYAILSPQTSFSGLAMKWLQATTISMKRNFVNSWLAEPWDETRGVSIQELTPETYEIVNTEGSVNILTVDVQENHYWVVVRKWEIPSKEHPLGQSWLILADRKETIEEIENLAHEHLVQNVNVVFDLAYRPNQVGKILVEHDWRGMWGTTTPVFIHRAINGEKTERIWSTTLKRDPHLGTKWQNRTFDRAIYVKFYKDGAMDLVHALRYATPTIWHIHANAHIRYQRQLNSRVREIRVHPYTGMRTPYWRELHAETHFLDIETMQVIRALQIGLLVAPDETFAV